jgi:hypothetical protein
MRRYYPSHATEKTMYGIDFSTLLPLGVGITDAWVTVYKNLNPWVWVNDTYGTTSTPDELAVSDLLIRGRRVYVAVWNGVPGTDYVILWNISDTLTNDWQQATYVLCDMAG